MADKRFKFEIITPEKVIYSADVEHVKSPGKNGYFGVKANHIPFLTLLRTGKITVEIGKEKIFFATSGGFAEVTDNKMTILAETSEETTKIDVERAMRARDRALKRLKEKSGDTNIQRARAALLRALNRLKVVSVK